MLPPPNALDWALKYAMPIPSDWTERLSREAILRSLGFRPPHHAHFRLSVTDVLGVRTRVFAHAMSKVDNVPDTAMWQRLGRLYFKVGARCLTRKDTWWRWGLCCVSRSGTSGVPEWSAEDGDGGSARAV